MDKNLDFPFNLYKDLGLEINDEGKSRNKVELALLSLNEKEQIIIRSRYINKLTSKEISTATTLSKSQVDRLAGISLYKMKDTLHFLDENKYSSKILITVERVYGVTTLPLGVKLFNCFKREDITSVDDIYTYINKNGSILKVRHLGNSGLCILNKALMEIGYPTVY